jgi:ubiquinone/menaquinone biosynthesis C-methylase UbiE
MTAVRQSGAGRRDIPLDASKRRGLNGMNYSQTSCPTCRFCSITVTDNAGSVSCGSDERRSHRGTSADPKATRSLVTISRAATLKQWAKQIVRRTIGEPYVGKRLKLRNLDRILQTAALGARNILDVGSEDALFVYWLADRLPDSRILAIDTDNAAISACRSTLSRRYAQRVEFRVAQLSDLPSEAFDLATAFDVLEHITDDRNAVAEMFRVLQPGGTLLAHVPRDMWTHVNGRQERVPDDEAWRINPGHVRMGYSPEGLSELARSVGFDVVNVQLWVRRWGTRAFYV